MATEYDFTPLINFLTQVFQRFRLEHPKSGKPYTYAEVGMLLPCKPFVIFVRFFQSRALV